jgi:hypothetical protein
LLRTFAMHPRYVLSPTGGSVICVPIVCDHMNIAIPSSFALQDYYAINTDLTRNDSVMPGGKIGAAGYRFFQLIQALTPIA